MVICTVCNIENKTEDSFCTQCGNVISQTTNKEENPVVNENSEESSVVIENSGENESQESSSKKGKLVFPDDSEIEIDESQRLVGRADLKKFLDSDSNDISRGHFTVYEEDNKYFLEDGSTNVQYKPSAEHTILNDEDITEKGRKELKDGSTIKISELVIHFKMD